MKKLLLVSLLVLVVAAGLTCRTSETDNQKPVSYIDEITPAEAATGETVKFAGHGTDPENPIVAFSWRSNLDGALSTKQQFETSSLSDGAHVIYFKVQNERGTWSDEVTASVSISGGTSDNGQSAATGKPVISMFNATPGSITTGETSTINWTVTGATTVSIDQEIGNVATSGNRAVSPASNMVYTLTATNAAGSVTASTQVIVSPVSSSSQPPTPPSSASTAAGMPDLIIEDITYADNKVAYTIKNQGDGDAGAFTAELLLDGVLVGNYLIKPLAAGASKDVQFGFTYSCSSTSDILIARVDTGGFVAESDETNNELVETWDCSTIKVKVPLPDLVVLDIFRQPISATEYYLAYRIKNQGTGTAGPSTTALFFYPCTDPCKPAVQNLGELAPGQEVIGRFFMNMGMFTGTTVGIEADYEDVVTESDDTNNTREEPSSGLF